jgi:hypothetical protein
VITIGVVLAIDLIRSDDDVLYAPGPYDDLPGVGDSIGDGPMSITMESGAAGENASLLRFRVTDYGLLEGTLTDVSLPPGAEIIVNGLEPSPQGSGFSEPMPEPGNSVVVSATLGGLVPGMPAATITIPGLVLTDDRGESVEVVKEFTFRLDPANP